MELSLDIRISLVALVFSIVAFTITFLYNRYLSQEIIRREKAVFFMERNAEFEGKLAEWPGAFKFYGIDLEEAKK
jgi:hypothetical protein